MGRVIERVGALQFLGVWLYICPLRTGAQHERITATAEVGVRSGACFLLGNVEGDPSSYIYRVIACTIFMATYSSCRVNISYHGTYICSSLALGVYSLTHSLNTNRKETTTGGNKHCYIFTFHIHIVKPIPPGVVVIVVVVIHRPKKKKKPHTHRVIPHDPHTAASPGLFLIYPSHPLSSPPLPHRA